MAGTAPATLLKGGVLLIHNEVNHVVPMTADLLVSEGKITKIGNSIDAPAHATIIDCTDKIISPGFIDTHRHMWQTQLKGTHANSTLVEYVPAGLAASSLFSPEDIFWAYKAIQATVSSGLRSVFCYTPTLKVKTWSPFEFAFDNTTAPWVMETFEKLAAEAPFGNSRVSLGFGFDGANYMPPEMVKETFKHLRQLGTKLTTIHSSGGPLFGKPAKTLATLASYAVLGPDVLLSHANDLPSEDAAILQKTGATISTTPSTELQMGLSAPIALDSKVYNNASLGVDCHCAAHSSIPGQMNLLLQHERARRHAKLGSQTKSGGIASDLSESTWSLSVGYQTEQVYNLGTILGAKACCMENEIGRIKLGYKADFAISSATSPAMLGAAQEDPVSAIVLHSSPSDIEMVMVDGIIRKQHWMLTPVKVAPITEVSLSAKANGPTDGSQNLEWPAVVKAVLKSRKPIVNFLNAADLMSAQKTAMQTFGCNVAGLV